MKDWWVRTEYQNVRPKVGTPDHCHEIVLVTPFMSYDLPSELWFQLYLVSIRNSHLKNVLNWLWVKSVTTQQLKFSFFHKN